MIVEESAGPVCSIAAGLVRLALLETLPSRFFPMKLDLEILRVAFTRAEFELVAWVSLLDGFSVASVSALPVPDEVGGVVDAFSLFDSAGESC